MALGVGLGLMAGETANRVGVRVFRGEPANEVREMGKVCQSAARFRVVDVHLFPWERLFAVVAQVGPFLAPGSGTRDAGGVQGNDGRLPKAGQAAEA